jgi:hypothetical protein
MFNQEQILVLTQRIVQMCIGVTGSTYNRLKRRHPVLLHCEMRRQMSEALPEESSTLVLVEELSLFLVVEVLHSIFAKETIGEVL